MVRSLKESLTSGKYLVEGKLDITMAGQSEGAMTTARYSNDLVKIRAKIFTAWFCEHNYFVSCKENALTFNAPILNMIGMYDEYFARSE